MLKAELRRLMLARRRALPAEELAARSAQVAAQLFSGFDVAAWRTVHVFLPLQRRQELDTWPIIRRLWAEQPGTRVVVPLVEADGTLTQRLLTPDTPLVESAWGIPEPLGAPQIKPAELDAVLLPLLAFDEQGQRVGYGKGFYDRFLLDCPQARRIGLSLEPPGPRIEDAWPGDVPLHACVTPERVWHFGPTAGGQ
ncbi:5-formyltetrahydrofolate cyclo-ligase [Hymenobacter jeollabukensis]|uniref:5-formyltetrahydrofolate cyclo-ligase n=1 Tax=Hymenobacter jeollabukensis TaxID=2025313 RepID=A0A5R8WS12_9BACT|nr:5-formyltetrahydrofolate cyclo-ligase [Hymenobacter jeollabukensis]TLM93984.1 5-formyltetrahydrofolate cyclo-ligase [Hymenobacter jeollabukensis]